MLISAQSLTAKSWARSNSTRRPNSGEWRQESSLRSGITRRYVSTTLTPSCGLNKMKQKTHLLVVLAGLCLVGCSSGSEVVEIEPAVPEDQLVTTLETIAETGDYSEVLTSLTMGLEQAGHMDQAVAVQGFRNLPGPDDVKKLARALAKKIRKDGAP